jgi:hypothetical protein
MKNYELTNNNSKNGLAILRITEGEFKNVEFAFNTISLNENENENTSNMTINFDVLKSPDERSCQDIENEASFQEMIGNIITNILEEYIDNKTPTS